MAMLAALVVGCAGPSRPAHPAPVAAAVATVTAAAAPCATYHCRPGATVPLTDGYSVRPWLSALPTTSAGERSTPVLELSRDGAHLSWWVGRIGFGWAASLHCLATAAEPNCVVSSAVGAHAGSAEVVLLRGGSLVAPATASAVFDSGAPMVADLDHDGRLDVLGLENDYRPNFATGHNFWASYRLIGDSLRRTGCQPARVGSAAPSRVLTGPCPVVAAG